jgi:hypothetical protein
MPRRLALFSLALLISAAVFAAHPVSPPEFGPADGSQWPRLAVSNGESFLVAWSGDHPAAVLLDALGAIEHRIPLPVIAAASDGTDYLVATHQDLELHVRIIHPDGSVTAGSLVAEQVADLAAVAFNGEHYLLVWVNAREQVLRGVLLRRDGVPVSEPFVIRQLRIPQSLSVASNGRDFLIAGDSGEKCVENSCDWLLYTIPVSSAGVAGERIVIPTGSPRIRQDGLVFNGAHYYLVWQDSAVGLTVVNSTILNDAGFPLRPAIGLASEEQQIAVAGAQSGAAVFEFRHLNQGVLARAVSVDGIPGFPAVAAETAPIDSSPAIVAAASDSSFLIAWNDQRLGALADVFAKPVPRDLAGAMDALPDGTLISTTARNQSSPSTDGVVVVWEERDPGSGIPWIAAAALRADGTMGPPLAVAEAGQGNHQVTPQVVAFRESHLVVWNEPFSGIFAAEVRLEADRLVAGPPRPVTRGTARNLAVVASPSGTLITWTTPVPDFRSSLEILHGAVISNETGELTASREIDRAVTGGASGVWTGDHFLLAYPRAGMETYICGASRSCSKPDIWTATIDVEGRPITTAPAIVSPLFDEEPALAWNGSVAMLLFTRYEREVRDGGGFLFVYIDRDLYSAVLTDTGQLVRSAEALAAHPADDSNPEVIWNGRAFLFLFEHRLRFLREDIFPTLRSSDIWSGAFDGAGRLISPPQFIFDTVTEDAQPDFGRADGRLVITWSHVDPSAGGVSRVFVESFPAQGRSRPAHPPK